MSFTDLQLTPPLLRAVDEAGYTQPSPIQQKSIPPVLAGRDLLGCAQTGTGKTAAFALPILQRLAAGHTGGRRPIRSLILTPTRELALQIQESFETYGKHLPLRSTVIFGGVGQGPQVKQLQRGVDVLVATPGRLNDLIGQGYVKLDKVEIFVLDEADRMLDMGFVNDVKKVIRQLPQKRQTLLYSATMPREIVTLADSLLTEPAKVFVTPPSTTVEKIEQHLYKVDKGNKRHLLAWLLRRKDVTSALVFTRTKHGADRVVRELKREGIVALAIHGNKSQGARQNALGSFKDGRVAALVATDIAARGLDINDLSHVFNYDLPNIPETYVHRIGRTGRAGQSGVAISFCSVDELPFLADIEKLIGFAISEEKENPWPMMVLEPTDPAAAKAMQQQRQNSGRRGEKKPAAAPARNEKPAPRAERSGEGKKPGQASNRKPQKESSRRAGPPAQNPYEGRLGGGAIITKRPVWAQGAPPEPNASSGQQGDDDMSRNNNRRRRNRSGKPAEGQTQQTTPAEGAKPAQNARAEQTPGQGARAEQGGGPGQARRRGRSQPQRGSGSKKPEAPKSKNGIFDFSEAELAEDDSLKLLRNSSQNNGDAKYASFDDFLKDH